MTKGWSDPLAPVNIEKLAEARMTKLDEMLRKFADIDDQNLRALYVIGGLLDMCARSDPPSVCVPKEVAKLVAELRAEVIVERARREGTEQAILTVAAARDEAFKSWEAAEEAWRQRVIARERERDEAIQRAEDAETQCSSMVSARDLTIRDLREKLAAANVGPYNYDPAARRV